MTFKTAKTVITLEGQDLVKLQEVLMDSDKEGALTFLRDVVGEKVTCAQAESHRPQFEGGTGDSLAHHLQQGEVHPDVGEAG